MIQNQLNHSFKVFEKGLLILVEKTKKGPVSLKTFLTALSGRGKVLLLIVTSLFFGQIPGVAIPFGLFIAYLGIRIALNGSSIWIPARFLKKKIPARILKSALRQALRFLKMMKRWTHPRYSWATQHPAMRAMNGLMIALVGVSTAISPPIPFGSLIAFIAIFLIGIGILNDDAVYVILGYGLTFFYFISVILTLHYFSFSQIVQLFRRTS